MGWLLSVGGGGGGATLAYVLKNNTFWFCLSWLGFIFVTLPPRILLNKFHAGRDPVLFSSTYPGPCT